MPETKAAEWAGSHQHDRRIAILVLIGLCVCLPHLFHFVKRRIDLRPQEKPPHRLLWLEGENLQGHGLYWLEGPPWIWPLPSAGPSCDHLPGDVHMSAVRLAPNGRPQTMAFPAQAAPIFFQPIPINQADLAALMTIPGIGRRLASSIIDYRDREGGIKDRTSLMAIEGIGEKKAAIIEGYIRYQ